MTNATEKQMIEESKRAAKRELARKEKMIDELFSLPRCSIVDMDIFEELSKKMGWISSNRIKRALTQRKSRLALKTTTPVELFIAINYINKYAA